MKESYFQMTNEHGMFLPFVLFIALILFSVITTLTLIYKNEVKVSAQLWEQMKAETIVQMSKRKFIAEQLYLESDAGTTVYSFPSGEAVITYTKMEDHLYILALDIMTDDKQNFSMEAIVIP